MCNLYSITKNQAAIRQLFAVTRDSVGNLPSMPGIFPDYSAPIVRNADGGRELAMARWGMPSSSKAMFDARDPVVVRPGLAEVRFKKRLCLVSYVKAGLDAERVELGRGRRANAVEFADG